MQAQDQTFADYITTLRRRWRPATLIGGGMFLAFIVLAFTIPAVYQSSATILIEQQKIPDDMVRSTVTSYADELMQTVQQRVMVSNNIANIINKLELYDPALRQTDMGSLIGEFRLNTALVPATAEQQTPQKSGRTAEVTYAFTVSFMYPDAQLAQKTVAQLAALYTTANESVRKESAADTTAFLDTEATRLQKQLNETEMRLSQFRARYGPQVTDNAALALSRQEQAEREMIQTETDLRASREQRDLLQNQLSQTPRYRPVVDDSGQPMLAGSDRLAQAQQELASLRGHYTDDHPDIVRLKQEIASLSAGPIDQSAAAAQIRGEIEVDQQELAVAREKYSANHPDVVRIQATIANLQRQLQDTESRSRHSAPPPPPTNPDYLQITTRMRTAEEEISALTQRRGELSTRLAQLQGGSFPSAQVEKEFADLNRDYSLLQTQYSDIRTKQAQATLALKLEAGQTGQKLTVIDPPQVPIVPIKPNRIMLCFLGFVLALAGALGAAAIIEATDKMVRGQKDVFALMGDAPLAIVPYIENRIDRSHRVKANALMISAAVCAVAVAITVIVL